MTTSDGGTPAPIAIEPKIDKFTKKGTMEELCHPSKEAVLQFDKASYFTVMPAEAGIWYG